MHTDSKPSLKSTKSKFKRPLLTDEEMSRLSNTERVVAIVDQLSSALDSAIGEIREINDNTKLLALNARIEAARSGTSGAAFGVVAQEMQGLSGKTAKVASDMSNRTNESIAQLVTIISGNVRGTRLADLTLNCLDLVDRNLYERTCDVRWWATDASIVDALADPTPGRLTHASDRMGIILNAYTVYLDLVLCDPNGIVVANGRPNLFTSVGKNESRSSWFTQAMRSQSGDQFGFQSAHCSPLVQDNASLIYSCSVRERGRANGKSIGALGVIFNWNNFANGILGCLPLDDVEKSRTTIYLVEHDGTVVAASKPVLPGYRFPVQRYERLIASGNGYVQENIDGKNYCVAHAKAPGFEGYSTDWHAFLIQEI